MPGAGIESGAKMGGKECVGFWRSSKCLPNGRGARHSFNLLAAADRAPRASPADARQGRAGVAAPRTRAAGQTGHYLGSRQLGWGGRSREASRP